MVGHGGLVAFDDTADMSSLAEYAMEFCAIESCGKCTPCRIGAVRGAEVISKIRRNEQREAQVVLLHELCDTMLAGSLCALGGMTPRSEEHTSELQSLMRNSYAVFCVKKK